MALLVLLLLFQGKFFRLFQVLNSMLFFLQLQNLKEHQEEWASYKWKLKEEKWGSKVPSSSFPLLCDAVNCKSPLMRLLHYGPFSFSFCFSHLLNTLSFSETICGKYEKKLLRHLMADYDSMERPVEDEGEPLMLTFGVTLQQIIDVVSIHQSFPSSRLQASL